MQLEAFVTLFLVQYSYICIKDYVPSAHGTVQTKIELGYNLVFPFVRGDGTASDFGRIPHIFTS